MKNIHVLPTDKPSTPSRLFYKDQELVFSKKYSVFNGVNIYITSNEKIKEGDWILVPSTDGKTYFDFSNSFPKKAKSNYASNNFVFKIILTTDADLIKDGVQAIDDEFLEWFVKNPSCEEVEVETVNNKWHNEDESVLSVNVYGLIIPKEEPKQLNSEDFGLPKIRTKEFNDLASALFGGKPKQDFILVKEDCPCTDECMYYLSKQCKHLKEEPKQETLEEVAERLYPYEVGYGVFDRNCEIDIERERFVEGVKWRQEQDKKLYSEEDMLNFAWFLKENLGQYSCDRTAHFEGKYLEQFKKK